PVGLREGRRRGQEHDSGEEGRPEARRGARTTAWREQEHGFRRLPPCRGRGRIRSRCRNHRRGKSAGLSERRRKTQNRRGPCRGGKTGRREERGERRRAAARGCLRFRAVRKRLVWLRQPGEDGTQYPVHGTQYARGLLASVYWVLAFSRDNSFLEVPSRFRAV